MPSQLLRSRTPLGGLVLLLHCLTATGTAQQPQDPLALIQPGAEGRGAAFLAVEVGRSTVEDVNQALGPATHVDGWTVERAGTELTRRHALSSVIVHFTADRVVTMLELALAKPLSLLDASMTLDLTSLPTGKSERDGRMHYTWQPAGIELVAEDENVVTVHLLAPTTAATAPPAPPAPPRAQTAQVERVWVEHDIPWQGQAALIVSASVIVNGMLGEPSQIEISFHDRSGRAVAASPRTPADYTDISDAYRALVSQAVPDAEWSLQPLRFAVPYEHLAADVRRPGEFAVRAKLVCGGLMAWSEAGVAAHAGAPARAVRLASVQMGEQAGPGASPGIIVLPGRSASSGPDVGGMGIDPRQPPAPLEAAPPTVTCTFELEGFDGQELTVVLGIRTRDGTVVRASEGAPPTCIGPDGSFQIVHRTSKIEGDLARTSTPPLALPVGHLSLPTGRHERLLLTVAGVCGSLSAGRWQPLSPVDAQLGSAATSEVGPRPLGLTPLHVAAAEGDESLVASLLAQGMDPRARTEAGDRPMDFAAHPAIRQRLAAATERLSAPERRAVREVVSGLLSATARGDRGAALGFLTPEEAARLPAQLPDVAMECRIAEVEVDIDTATVLVSMKAPQGTPVGDRFLMTAHLERRDEGGNPRWLVAKTRVESGEVQR